MQRRFSKKRMAIYHCLAGTKTHPSAEWVFEQVRPEFPDISLATVYRNLRQLEAQGLIRRVATVGGEERFDANMRPHAHFICTQCHAVIDINNFSLPSDLSEKITASTGGQVSGINLLSIGVCKSCLEKNNTSLPEALPLAE